MGFTTDSTLSTDNGKVKYVFKRGNQIINSIEVKEADSVNFESSINSRVKNLSSEFNCSESDISWSKKVLI